MSPSLPSIDISITIERKQKASSHNESKQNRASPARHNQFDRIYTRVWSIIRYFIEWHARGVLPPHRRLFFWLPQTHPNGEWIRFQWLIEFCYIHLRSHRGLSPWHWRSITFGCTNNMCGMGIVGVYRYQTRDKLTRSGLLDTQHNTEHIEYTHTHRTKQRLALPESSVTAC